MAEFYQQFAFINAILGGFAFSFLGVLLTVDSKHRVVSWITAITAGAAACFIIATLGATFSGIAVIAAAAKEVPLSASLLALRKPMSLIFLGGVLLLLVSLGMSGWLRSRILGIVTTIIAILAVFGAVFMMTPFID